MSQAPADWYPQEDGRLRYWDGLRWTDHFARGPEQQATNRPSGALTRAIKSVVAVAPTDDQEAIWQAVGKPLTGLGAGRYRLTSHYLFFEKGLLSTNAQQVPIAAVLDVDVKQSMTQKAREVATITVHIQRARGVELVQIDDVPDFREAQRLINETAHNARLAIQRNQNTHRHENTHLVGQLSSQAAAVGLPQLAVAGSRPPEEAAPDPIGQLRQLGQLHEAGVLTDEEFTAKKAEILSRL